MTFRALLFALLFPAMQSALAQAPALLPRYLTPSLPIEQRIDDLLPRMTLEEKITQISDDWGSKDVPRLKIPPMLKTEGLHSQSYSNGATIFPHAIAMAASFDLQLVGEIGKQTALECKAASIRGSWSPVLDVVRDVRWGRVEETYGESPYLVGRVGVAWIKAFQAEGMFAVPKHFAGHGQPVGGRDSNDFGLSERTMRNTHLPPFREAIEEAKAEGVMAAYGVWTDGQPDNASTTLLHKILRQEWGFDGMVVSDCSGIEHFLRKHSVANNSAEAAMLGVTAGVNMECGSLYRSGALEAALEKELITEAQIDALVRPTLRLKMKLGLFEKPGPAKMNWDKLPEYDTPQARALARKTAVEGSVLLRNQNGLLPLDPAVKTIAVIGPNADEAQTGDYSPKIVPGQMITVLQGIRNHVGPGTTVLHAKGLDDQFSTDTSKFAEAVKVAQQADVVVLVVGDRSLTGAPKASTGENRDGATLDFPGAQRQLIRVIQETGKPVALVIVNGKPFTLPWEAENIPAILVTWYPGEEGGNATADLLFGKENPSGRLPVTWPRHVGQVPIFHDYATSGRRYDYYDMPATPQYRFGFGLSYTEFTYSNLKCTPKQDDPGYVTVNVDVTNTGSRDGDEVAQLYLTDVVASVATPVIQLQGFQRVSLKKGEKKTLAFELTPYQLSLLDPEMIRRVEPGLFRVHVGRVSPEMISSNDDHKQNTKFTKPTEGVTGEFTVTKPYRAEFVYNVDLPAKVAAGQPFPLTLKVKNSGNLTDVTAPTLFGEFKLADHSFELAPGEEKSCVFQPSVFRSGNLTIVAGNQLLSRAVTVDKSPARAVLSKPRWNLDDKSTLQVTCDAQNVGSEPFTGAVGLTIDGQPAGQKQTVELKPGETRVLSFAYTFPVAGLHKVQIGNSIEKQIVVRGGLGLAMKNPLIYVTLEEGQGAETKNLINGRNLKITGSPKWVPGRGGQALELTGNGMGVAAENTDIYRKPFTLSAWIKITEFGNNGEIGLFGGRAPMGADQDTNGTVLQVGTKSKKPFQGFFGRDITGSKEVPSGEWINLTYTYDPAVMKGTFYINGDRDKESSQKPYMGPLETIGDAPMLKHGNYLLDEAVVIQDCLSSGAVNLLAKQGMNALLEGEYVSDWRSLDGAAPSEIEAVTELPAGTAVTLTVEGGDAAGKATSSKAITLDSGARKYSTGLPGAEQVRIRAKLSSTDWKSGPILRAVAVGGQRWSSESDWKRASGSLAVVSK